MKNLKSFAARTLRTKKIPIPELKLLIIFCCVVLIPSTALGQIEDLAQELERSRSGFERVADIIISAVKTIAAVSVIIGALVFLYLREQQNDLTKKVGQIIIGIVLFWIILAVGDSIRS